MAVKNAMRSWITAATKEELQALAVKARTTLGTLRQLAGGYRSGGRAVASSDLAVRIELATKDLVRPGLFFIPRGDLSKACARCNLYRASVKV